MSVRMCQSHASRHMRQSHHHDASATCITTRMRRPFPSSSICEMWRVRRSHLGFEDIFPLRVHNFAQPLHLSLETLQLFHCRVNLWHVCMCQLFQYVSIWLHFSHQSERVSFTSRERKCESGLISRERASRESYTRDRERFVDDIFCEGRIISLASGSGRLDCIS